MRASEFQAKIKQQLDKYYSDVRLEWSVTTDAADLLQRDIRRYAPRVDVAIGPFNTSPGRDSDIRKELVAAKMLPSLASLPTNPNPRCLIAIEVTYSGSSKHILGDILNASAQMGCTASSSASLS